MTCAVAGRTNPERGHQPRLSKPRTPIPEGTPFLATWLAEAGFHTEDPDETQATLERVDRVSERLWEALQPERERMEALLGDTVTRRPSVFELED